MARNTQSSDTTEILEQKDAGQTQETPAAVPAEKRSAQLPEGYHTIEELKAQLGTPTPVFNGVCAYHAWQEGKSVTAEEYFKALEEFRGAPMGRRKAT